MSIIDHGRIIILLYIMTTKRDLRYFQGKIVSCGRMIRTLLVDDEHGLCEITRIFLERSGNITVDTALSPKIAYQKMAREHYDVIISDYEMPEMNGIEFLKGLRAANNTIPFIIFTGRGSAEVATEALDNGADFYLQKKGDPREQYRKLQNMLLQAVKLRRPMHEILAGIEGRYE